MQDFRKDVLGVQSIEETFTWIYTNEHWKSNSSVSGTGSTVEYTENLRKELPALLEKFSIKSVLDAPCGDLNWMQHVLPTLDIDYIGVDIVKPLIEANREMFGNSRTSFMHLDLINDALPRADLLICRDCLPHLSFENTDKFLTNFVQSGIPYLLTTTHFPTSDFSNMDIQTGDFRMINLFAAPYNFPINPPAVIEDWVEPFPKRQMYLWSAEQVSTAIGKSPNRRSYMRFTESEIAGVERLYNVKWDELSELSQVFRGLIYRNVWSPEAIANRIVNGEEKE